MHAVLSRSDVPFVSSKLVSILWDHNEMLAIGLVLTKTPIPAQHTANRHMHQELCNRMSRIESRPLDDAKCLLFMLQFRQRRVLAAEHKQLAKEIQASLDAGTLTKSILELFKARKQRIDLVAAAYEQDCRLYEVSPSEYIALGGNQKVVLVKTQPLPVPSKARSLGHKRRRISHAASCACRLCRSSGSCASALLMSVNFC